MTNKIERQHQHQHPSTSDSLIWLGLFEFVNCLYRTHLKSLTVVNLDYVVTNDNIDNDHILIDINLYDHLKLETKGTIILNPKIHITLPLKVFPIEEDYLGFEYELMILNDYNSKKITKENIIVRIQLFDTLIK